MSRAVIIKGNARSSKVAVTVPSQHRSIQTLNGPPGKSAYQIWLDQGNSGSESDFLAQLSVAGQTSFATTDW